MKALSGVRVLLIEADDDSRELLSDALRSYGADVRAVSSGEGALEAISGWNPEVVLSELELPGVDGAATVAQLRQRSACAAIALTGRAGDGDRTRSLSAGFAKHLAKPARIGDIVSAIDAVRVRAWSENASELRSALAELNAQSGCRYTSILRFAEDQTLVSIWTHDREQPDADPFPVGLPIAASYCLLVQQSGEACTIEDASADPRVAEHPKRDQLACYVGEPIWRTDGSLFGTLCSYDADPRTVTPELRALHAQVARRLRPMLARLFEAGTDVSPAARIDALTPAQ